MPDGFNILWLMCTESTEAYVCVNGPLLFFPSPFLLDVENGRGAHPMGQVLRLIGKEGEQGREKKKKKKKGKREAE